MELAVVIGQVVSTVKCPGIRIERLLLVDFVDTEGKPRGEPHVAADSVGAGDGEWVLVTQGSSARRTSSDAETLPISKMRLRKGTFWRHRSAQSWPGFFASSSTTYVTPRSLRLFLSSSPCRR